MKYIISPIIDELKRITYPIRHLEIKETVILITVPVLLIISVYLNPHQLFNKLNSEFGLFNEFELASHLFRFSADIVLFLITPAILIKFVFKENISDYGLNLRNLTAGTGYMLTAFVPIFLISWFISSDESILSYYPYARFLLHRQDLFWYYQCGLLLYMISWEFLFRGFTLFGLNLKYGISSVLIQSIPFALMHIGKPFPETLSSVIGGIMLGLIAIRLKSIIYGVKMHYLILFLTDSFVILRINISEYGVGVNSFINICKSLF